MSREESAGRFTLECPECDTEGRQDSEYTAAALVEWHNEERHDGEAIASFSLTSEESDR